MFTKLALAPQVTDPVYETLLQAICDGVLAPDTRLIQDELAERLGMTARLEADDVLRPGSPAGAIEDWLATREDADLMLVGHNPNLTDLLGLLLGMPAGPLPFDLKKAGAAALRAGDTGRYELQWLVTPKLVRGLTD